MIDVSKSGHYTGDCRDLLKQLPDGCVQTCVTSPPYWGLRDYGVDGQLGLEQSPQEYAANMIAVFRDVRRALKDDGTLWLNLGDTYATASVREVGRRDHGNTDESTSRLSGNTRGAVNPGPRTRITTSGPKPKDLVGIPWMVAFALREDGWYLRSDIIWHKPNPMPESVTDRPTKAHEYVFLLSKSSRYLYDASAIAERSSWIGGGFVGNASRASAMGHPPSGNESGNEKPGAERPGDARNKRTVWTVTPEPFAGAHFATMPPGLVEPCILAGSRAGDVVLDPFFGSGTTGMVAEKHGRKWIGFDLNPEYEKIQKERTAQRSLPMGGNP